ncbi:dioxygenase [filamentous cyanobacterium LEGE 11480]|uniref:Dioxygenase n=1 Tax=Romeriopsis navalis LEGE 11480 TaxID=2777977 RepID=A0A928VKP4_9CYAN|nr:class III extradiol ring-cleavage dioxygenase [Romeriopsis navalis]MBE9029427.1 dioxygenase [Romeriopsis navalis LEGE 11480]
MNHLPTLFLSHGAPDLAIHQGATQDFLQVLPEAFPRPKAILVISAHWHSRTTMVSGMTNPATIHDFSGFASELYAMQYKAPGSPQLAIQIQTLLEQSQIPCRINPDRGLDHGAWVPLMLMYPAADIPIVQLSINYEQTPEYHWKIGQAIAILRHQGVLIIGSGSMTHNLAHMADDYDTNAPHWVKQFDQWMQDSITQLDRQRLINYRRDAPYAAENHPTEEHLLPLFVVIGAAGKSANARQIHQNYTYSVLSMAAYAFN